MTHIAAPLQHGSHQTPFLPYKFYDALQRAPFALKVLASDVQDDAPKDIVAPTKRTGRGRPVIARTNSLKPYLRGFNSPGHALRHLPHFDDIVTGAVSTDFGSNTRPLSKKLVITLLQRLDVISTEGVQEYMHLTLRRCSERHAQKIAQCLRVIEHAAKVIAVTQWPSPGEASEHLTFDSTNYITPCGSDTCAICSGSTKQSWDWSHYGTCEAEGDIVKDWIEQAEDWAPC